MIKYGMYLKGGAGVRQNKYHTCITSVKIVRVVKDKKVGGGGGRAPKVGLPTCSLPPDILLPGCLPDPWPCHGTHEGPPSTL